MVYANSVIYGEHLTLLWCLVAKSYLILVTLWTLAHQAPLSIWFSRQEYWIELPFPSPRDLLDPGIELGSLVCIGRWVLYQLSHQGILPPPINK